jgi:hypothetical protein
MKTLILIITVVMGVAAPAAPAAAASWDYRAAAWDAQPQKGRGGAQDQGQRGREARPDRQANGGGQRREQLNEDERRALHRDLDKANRELYRRR